MATNPTGKDRIYTIKLNKDTNVFEGELIQRQDMDFDVYHPIETIPIYENEDISKVYWTDNKNQPRVINITDDALSDKDANSFDFIQPLTYEETIAITKNDIGGGIFPAGIIQYAFTYFNEFMQETNIFYISPIYYLSFSDRAGSPEESVSNSFNIKLTSLDERFNYIRIYSIIRTSIEGTPIVRRVADIKVSSSELNFTDSNTTGSLEDPTKLLYIGGEELYVKTFANKDNTLFLGNLNLTRLPIGNLKVVVSEVEKTIKDALRATEDAAVGDCTIVFSARNATGDELFIEGSDGSSSNYPYNPDSLKKASNEFKTFKWNETYRFGIQGQHISGKWSEVIWINDVLNTIQPQTNTYIYSGSNPGDITVRGSKASYTITNTDIVDELIANGYKNLRGVYVVPTLNDRTILAQGIINPVISNFKDRYENSPYVQSSWALRPMLPDAFPDLNSYVIGNDDLLNYDLSTGVPNEFRHYKPLPGQLYRNAEILSNSGESPLSTETLTTLHAIGYHPQEYFVDQSIQTFYSPELEFDTSLLTSDKLEDVRMRIIGLACLTGNSSYLDISVTSPSIYSSYVPKNIHVDNYNVLGYKNNISGLFYLNNPQNETGTDTYYFMIYPWHKQGSLLDDQDSRDPKVDILANKNMSNLRYCGFNKYLTTSWEANDDTDTDKKKTGITNVYIQSNTNDNSIKIKYNNKDYNYSGNVNKILLSGIDKYSLLRSALHSNLYDAIDLDYFYASLVSCGILESQPIVIKYKSANHAIFGFNWTEETTPRMVIAPSLGIDNIYDDSNPVRLFYEDTDYNIFQDNTITSLTDNNFGGVWLTELYRDVNSDVIYGGNSVEAIENNLWVPCGNSVDLVAGNTVTVEFIEGDTYIQRYDCLRTQPYSLSDYQTNVEIVSFLCETHINLDGRYDKNRGNVDNRVAMTTNFNLMNSVYSQSNNYFTHRTLNYDRFALNNFPNTVTWTNTKTTGELIDTWTNTTMASTLDVDGIYGQINSLNSFNNEIIGFQDLAVFNVLFNNRIQISPSDGVPIEISNSGKVEGRRYLSTNIGCRNKWSVTQSPYGLYFIDENSKSINIYNGKFEDLSTKLGFSSWCNQNIDNGYEWNPYSFNNYVTTYDKQSKNIHFINRDYCLTYSELSGGFISFNNYQTTPFIFNINDSCIALRNNFSTTRTNLWEVGALSYPSYFGVPQKSYTTLLVNPDANLDKVFWGIEFRADSKESGQILRYPNISSFKSWNETQYGILDMEYSPYTQSSLKEKFRVWKTNFPRVNYNYTLKYNEDIVNPHKINVFDNIRNTWTYLKMTTDNYTKPLSDTLIHDLIITYNI